MFWKRDRNRFRFPQNKTNSRTSLNRQTPGDQGGACRQASSVASQTRLGTTLQGDALQCQMLELKIRNVIVSSGAQDQDLKCHIF